MTVRAIALAVALAISSPVLANAPPDAVENILAVYLDGKEIIPTTVLQQTADGDVWLEVEDWARFPGLNLELDGKTGLVSARSLGLEPTFLAERQAIDMTVPATRRAAQRLGRPRKAQITAVNPQPKGVLVNYDVAGRANDRGDWSLSVGHEARFGVGAATVSTMGQLNHTPDGGTDYTRSLTTLHYDHLPTGVAYQAGDVFTPRTNLSGTVNLGGIRVGSDRALRRHHNFLPVPTLGGLVEDASTAELFVNGRKAAQHSLTAGPWEVDQYPVSPGSNAVRVVVRDDFGREQVIEDRFYLSPDNLPKGTSEWEVAAGLVREGGDDYGTPAVSAAFERGMTDTWTLGAHVEGTQDAQALTLTNRVVLGNAGILSADLRGTQSEFGSGHAASLSYDYRADDWGLNVGHSRYSETHWTLGQERGGAWAIPSRQLLSSTAVSATHNPRGSQFSAALSGVQLEFSDGSTRQRVDLSGRWRNRDHAVGVGVGYTPDDGAMAWATYRYSMGPGRSMSVSARQTPDLSLDARLSGRNAVAGREVRWAAGAGDRAGQQHAWAQASTLTPKGPVSMDVRHNAQGTDVSARFESSVWVGEGGVATQGPSRHGSFLVVEVPGQANVPVSAGGGSTRTNARGVAVVPGVYPLAEQRVSVDTRDMDLNVGLENATVSAVAGRHGGGKVVFELLSERLLELRLTHEGQPIDSPAAATTDTERVLIGKGGVAVLLKPSPGQVLTVEHAGGTCRTQLPEVLPGVETIVELDCQEAP